MTFDEWWERYWKAEGITSRYHPEIDGVRAAMRDIAHLAWAVGQREALLEMRDKLRRRPNDRHTQAS